MVEINNQRVPRYAGVVWGNLITDVRKPEIMAHVIVGGELFTDYSDHLQTCHAKPKTQINRRRTLPAFFPLRDAQCVGSAWPERLLSEKSGRCGIAAD